jgi:hypothetical protein
LDSRKLTPVSWQKRKKGQHRGAEFTEIRGEVSERAKFEAAAGEKLDFLKGM